MRSSTEGQIQISSLWRFVADLFATRVRLLPLLASILIPVVATTIVWLGYALVSGQSPLDLIANLSVAAVVVMFFDSLIRGPFGEEVGWRGYLQNELTKRFLPAQSLPNRRRHLESVAPALVVHIRFSGC
jgi:membrane protease YdiL (CAAX protease family)